MGNTVVFLEAFESEFEKGMSYKWQKTQNENKALPSVLTWLHNPRYSLSSDENIVWCWWLIQAFSLDKISEVFGGQASGKLSFLRNFSVFFWWWLSFLKIFSVFMAISSCFPQFSAKMLTFWVKSVKSYQFSWKNWKTSTFSPFWKPENWVIFPLVF